MLKSNTTKILFLKQNFTNDFTSPFYIPSNIPLYRVYTVTKITTCIIHIFFHKKTPLYYETIT